MAGLCFYMCLLVLLLWWWWHCCSCCFFVVCIGAGAADVAGGIAVVIGSGLGIVIVCVV